MWTLFAVVVIALAILGAFVYRPGFDLLLRRLTHGRSLGTVSPEWLAEHRNHH